MDQNNAHRDNAVIERLRKGEIDLGTLYTAHRKYALDFMSGMYHDENEIKDIYQDAIIVLYEKALKDDFKLTCSIQTYLNSICRNQVLLRFKKNKISTAIDWEDGISENLTDWLEQVDDQNNERLQAMKSVFQAMKLDSSKCYEMLIRFWYRKQTMERIANDLGYANADSVKNQKARCQKYLRGEVIKILHGR